MFERDDIKDVYAEMKGTGFDVKAVRQLVRLRKQDQAERQEAEAILDLYKAALGMAWSPSRPSRPRRGPATRHPAPHAAALRGLRFPELSTSSALDRYGPGDRWLHAPTLMLSIKR